MGQDGATAHTATASLDLIQEQFGFNIMSGKAARRGGQDWAANSPDMSPMDFFLWPYMNVNLTYGQSGVSVMSHQTKDDMVTF